METLRTRVEKDSMGEMRVPEGALYGAQTQRAVENFPISGQGIGREMVRALGIIKASAAEANKDLGLLGAARAGAIVAAAREVEHGRHDSQFVVDVFQTGSGTSSNMNANEVIARLATLRTGKGMTVHPNDHVNMCQSSNDVFPSAIHVAAVLSLRDNLVPALDSLAATLGRKREEFSPYIKSGRTHLMDATPITLGQEFSGYEAQVRNGSARVTRAMDGLYELALGGTAVGTGLNTHPEFASRALSYIQAATGVAFVEARNHFEAQAAKDALLELSGVLKTIACSLGKVANDIRWLGSGPRCGLAELVLPEVQPGSSIMPGKINPVIAESLLMVVAQVVGNDAAVTVAAHSGSQFELNTMMPVIAKNILESISLLSRAASNFDKRCVTGLKANPQRLKELAEASIATVTALAPRIGYDEAARCAKEAFATGLSVREVVRSRGLLSEEDLDALLDLARMTRPDPATVGSGGG